MTKRTGLRFNLDEPKDKVVYEYIRSLDKSSYKSINKFMIEAMYQYIQSMTKLEEERSVKELIQETIRDELKAIFGSMLVGQPIQTQSENISNTPEDAKAVISFLNSMA